MTACGHAHFDHFLAAEEVCKACGANVTLRPALPLQRMMLGIPAASTPTAAPDRELADVELGIVLLVLRGRQAVLHV